MLASALVDTGWGEGGGAGGGGTGDFARREVVFGWGGGEVVEDEGDCTTVEVSGALLETRFSERRFRFVALISDTSSPDTIPAALTI